MKQGRLSILHITIFCAIALSLLFTLTFSFGYDQYIFMIGGEKMFLHGGVPFRDVMDTKPLLIMYTYGFASWLFGHHFYSIRVLDGLYHCAALYYFYRVLRRMMTNDSYALLSVCIYALLYAAIDYAWTAQAESFILLPVLLLLDITDRMMTQSSSSKYFLRYAVLSALATFIILSYKVSLIAAPISLAIWLLFASEQKKRETVKFLFVSLSFLFVFCAALVLLFDNANALPAAKENLSWLSNYARISDLFYPLAITGILVDKFTDNLVGVLTFSVIVLGAIGVYVSVSKQTNSSGGDYWKSKRTPVMFLFTAFTLTASLLLEGKVIEYQYIRIFWTIVPFISVGCFFAAGSIRTAWKRAHSSRVTAIWMRLVCVALSVTFLFFSPVYILADRAMHRLSLYREGQYSGGIIVDDETLDREKGMYALAKRIEPKLQPEDNIFVFGERPALYFHLKRTPPTMLISDGFVTASWAPQRWKDKILHDLDSEKPRFIFIGKNDVMSIINESSDDSWQFFLNWPKFHEMVINEYSPIDTVSAFMAFERK